MKIYLDTNVLLSFFITGDIAHKFAKQILSNKTHEFYTAPITFLEFGSRISQLWRKKGIRFSPEFEKVLSELPMDEQIKLIEEYCWQQINVNLVSNSLIEKFKFLSIDLAMEDTLSLALKFHISLPIKTLDLIQVASAMKIKLYANIDLDYFLTDDMMILDHSNEIYQKTHFLPISTKKLADILDEVNEKMKSR